MYYCAGCYLVLINRLCMKGKSTHNPTNTCRCTYVHVVGGWHKEVLGEGSHAGEV